MFPREFGYSIYRYFCWTSPLERVARCTEPLLILSISYRRLAWCLCITRNWAPYIRVPFWGTIGIDYVIYASCLRVSWLLSELFSSVVLANVVYRIYGSINLKYMLYSVCNVTPNIVMCKHNRNSVGVIIKWPRFANALSLEILTIYLSMLNISLLTCRSS